MACLAIVADDITGANDTGIKLLPSGHSTSVILDYSDLTDENKKNILALNTNTREIDSDDAYQIVRESFFKLKEMGYQFFYKKIDSIFRGNVGKEIDAMMDALDYDVSLIVAAIPSNGRVIKNGYLHITSNGKGEEKIYIPEILHKQTDKKIGLITLDKIRGVKEDLIKEFEGLSSDNQIIILDTETDEDLQIISKFLKCLNKKYGLVGASGIASYIPEIWDFKNSLEEESLNKSDKLKSKKKTLIVAGSFHNETSVQVKSVMESPSTAYIKVDTDVIIKNGQNEELDNIKNKIQKIITDEEKELIVLVVDTLINDNSVVNSQYSDIIADTITEGARILIDQDCFDKLILTGGDTAYRVLKKIGSSEIELIDEVLMGIPVGVIADGKNKGDIVVTKSGRFGSEDAFLKIIEYLQKNS